MTIQYTYVAPHLPENKMRLYPTRVINIIGGPGSDKSLFTAAIILYLHLHHKTVELIPDYAKSVVWRKDFEALRNQYQIAQQQFQMLELLDGQVQYLVTEASLPQILYYNEFYPDNICDVGKTRKQIHRLVQAAQQHQRHGRARQRAQIHPHRALPGRGAGQGRRPRHARPAAPRGHCLHGAQARA
jgi:hypothetical protein